MRVPLTVLDFIERAEIVYGDRIGIVDEPDQPAAALGELTWAEVARRTVRPGTREIKVDIEGADHKTQSVTWPFFSARAGQWRSGIARGGIPASISLRSALARSCASRQARAASSDSWRWSVQKRDTWAAKSNRNPTLGAGAPAPWIRRAA